MNIDLELALMSGINIPIPNLQLILHQPKIKDIAFLGEEKFFTCIHYLTLKKEIFLEDKEDLEDLSNFQIIMKILHNSSSSEKKTNIISLFSILFPEYKTIFTPNSILLNNIETKETKIIDENNFDEFINLLSLVLCVNDKLQGDNIIYKPANETAKKIAAKIMKNRQRIAKQKQETKNSTLAKYISILSIGLQELNIDNIINLTLYQLFDLIERYGLYVEWDLNIKTKLAGSTSKEPVENWMKTIH